MPIPDSRFPTPEHRVHEPDVSGEGSEDGIGRKSKTVGAYPLEPADPDGHLGEVVGVGVDLDAVELPRTDAGKVGTQTVLARECDGRFALKVFEAEQGDIEEVAGAAGGIENLDLAQPGQKLFSKQNDSPVGSAAAGVGWSNTLHRSRKCSCAAERSFNSTLLHLQMNSDTVIGPRGYHVRNGTDKSVMG